MAGVRNAHARLTHEQAARKCETEFARLFPLTHAAFCEFGRVAP